MTTLLVGRCSSREGSEGSVAQSGYARLVTAAICSFPPQQPPDSYPKNMVGTADFAILPLNVHPRLMWRPAPVNRRAMIDRELYLRRSSAENPGPACSRGARDRQEAAHGHNDLGGVGDWRGGGYRR